MKYTTEDNTKSYTWSMVGTALLMVAVGYGLLYGVCWLLVNFF